MDTEREGRRREEGRIHKIDGFGRVRANGRGEAGSHKCSSLENRLMVHQGEGRPIPQLEFW